MTWEADLLCFLSVEAMAHEQQSGTHAEVCRHSNAQVGHRRNIRRVEVEFHVLLPGKTHLPYAVDRRTARAAAFVDPDLDGQLRLRRILVVRLSSENDPVFLAPFKPDASEVEGHLIAKALESRGLGGQ